MRERKALSARKDMTTVLVQHDVVTNLPLSVLISQSAGSQSDSLTAVVNGRAFVSDGYLDTVEFQETKPSQGFGLIRRTAKISIVGSDMYESANWTKRFYVGGVNSDSFYFSLWLVPSGYLNKDIAINGECLGKFVIDAGLQWNERDSSVNFTLLDITLSWEEKLNHYPQESSDALLGTEWAELIGSNIYYGTFRKVRMFKPAKTSTVITGLENSAAKVHSGYVTAVNTGVTEITLGKNGFLAANVNANVKVLFGNNEIIYGQIVAAGDVFKLNVIGRDTALDSVNVIAAFANSPVDNALKINQLQLSDLSAVVGQGMHLKIPTVNFYDTTSPGNIAVTNKVIKLGRIIDRTNRVMVHSDITDPVSTVRTEVGISYTSGATNSAFPDEPQFNHAVADNAIGMNSQLYFRNKAIALERPPAVGDTWIVYRTATVNFSMADPAEYKAGLLRVFKSSVQNVYVKVGNNYSLISPVHYTITENFTFNGIDKLVKVNFTKDLPNIAPGVDVSQETTPTSTTITTSIGGVGVTQNFGGAPNLEGEIYVDLVHTIKLDRFIDELVSGFSAKAYAHMGRTIRSYATACPGMISSAVITVDDSLSDILDTLLYENGCTLRWRKWNGDSEYYLELEDYIHRNMQLAIWPDTTDPLYAFCQPLALNKISNSEIISNSFSLSVGKLDTTYDVTTDTEYVSAYSRLSYQPDKSSNATYIARSARVRGKKDRFHEYALKHATTIEGMNRFGAIAVQGPSPSALCQTTRTITFDVPLYRMDLEAGDTIDLRNIKIIDDSIKPPLYRAPNGDIYYRYSDANKYILVPNLFQLEEVRYNLTQGAYVISCTLKQIQHSWYSNVINSEQYEPGVPGVGSISISVTQNEPYIPDPSNELPGGDAPGPWTGPVGGGGGGAAGPCGPAPTCTDGPGGGDGAGSTGGTGGTGGGQSAGSGGSVLPSAEYKFQLREYIVDLPGGCRISTDIAVRGSVGGDGVAEVNTSNVLVFFDAVIPTAPGSDVHCRNSSAGCSELDPVGTGPILTGEKRIVGEGVMLNCCWTPVNWAQTANLVSSIEFEYDQAYGNSRPNIVKDYKTADATACLKPLLIPRVTLA